MQNKIFKLSEIDKLQDELRSQKVVLVGGCFDLIHYGHLVFLQNAKKEGDILVVALESDEFIKTRKKRQPVHTQQQRAEILASLEMVDKVILLPLMETDADYSQLVKDIVPQVIAITEGDKYKSTKAAHAEQVGAEVKEVVPVLSTFSSSSIISYASIFSD